jgi:hypothetical protein
MHVDRPLGGHALRHRMSQSRSCSYRRGQTTQLRGISCPYEPFFVFESAVNLRIPPLEFTTKAEVILEVDSALAILGEIGFDDIPVRIRNKEALRDAILYSYEAGQRLNEIQRRWFNSRMFEVRL